MKLGDKVRVHTMPNITLGNPEDEAATKAVFASCLGKVFEVKGFDSYGHVELHVGHLRDKQDYSESIWIEPECLEVVS